MAFNRLAYRLFDLNTANLTNGAHYISIRVGSNFDSHNGNPPYQFSVPFTTNQTTIGPTANISIQSINNTASLTFYKATPQTVQFQFATSVIGTMSGSSGATYSVTGLPSGATAVFSPSSGTFDGTSTGPTTSLNVDAVNTAAGTYPLTVKVTAYGLTRSCNVTLVVQAGVVTPPPPAPAPSGWTISFGGQDSYPVGTPCKLSVLNNGYPVTTCTNIIWTVSMGANPTPEPGGNSNWLYDYTLPSSNATVVVNAVINMPGGVSYSLPPHSFSAVALGNPQLTSGPNIIDEDGGYHWTVIWTAAGAQSGDWSVGAQGGDLNVNTLQSFSQTFNLTNVPSPCDFVLNLYGGPNKTGTALHQTWQVF